MSPFKSIPAVITAIGAFTILVGQPAAHAAKSDDPALVTKAQKEGSLTFYTVVPIPEDQKAIALFNLKYPNIKVNLVREGTGPLDERYAAEAHAGVTAADIVIQPSEDFVKQAQAQHWSLALTPDVVPAVSNWPTSNIHETYVDIMIVPWGIEYNTDLVKIAPTSYADLAAAAYSGKLIFTSPLNGAPESVGWQEIFNTFGKSLLQKLAAQNPTFVASDVPAVQGVASGQYAAAVFSQPGLDSSLIENGAPIKFVLPDYTAAFPQYMIISTNAPHPAAARLFANFLMTEKGQAAFIAGNGISPLHNVPGAVIPPAHLWIGNTTESAKGADDFARLLGEQQ